MAGYGMKGLFVAQDLEQVEEVYGEKTLCGAIPRSKCFTRPPTIRPRAALPSGLWAKGRSVTGRRSTRGAHGAALDVVWACGTGDAHA